jgi:ABC-2 type transport system ATP-binding protein
VSTTAAAPAPADPGAAPDVPAIRTAAITKRYGALVAVDHLDLVIPTGSVFGLIGPNGAGKTTTFAILATLLRPTSGEVFVAGEALAADPYRARRRLGFMPDVVGVYDNLQVDEYLRFFAAAGHVARRDRDALIGQLLELVDLTGKRHTMVDALSRGMKQRLSLARALVHDPDILILDEPASGLDPRARVELRLLVGELAAMGKTIVVSSHILAELQEMCTHVGIMETGRLLAAGSPQSILEELGGAIRLHIRYRSGAEEERTVTSIEAQEQLLHRLVAEEGRDVVEFHQVGGGLEELFLEITEGAVQ